MFGIIRPCRNRLDDELRASWMAHLCGMCLALRDEHGQLARLVTNFDAVAVSALVEAQTGTHGWRRQAGPCALRGMRTASVADGGGARLAASVSLLLASAKLRDHVEDGDLDGALRVRATNSIAKRWARAGAETGTAIALDTRALLEVVDRQRELEVAPTSILDVTAPAETATALAFAHTAVVAGRPENAEPLAEAGRLFGRLAHLLDAVEDLHSDRASGAWNPIAALSLSPTQVRQHCDDAVLGIRLALRDATFVDDRLVHILLVHELETAVRRTFAGAGQPPPPLTPPLPPDQQPPDQQPLGWGLPRQNITAPDRPGNRGFWAACAGWLAVCGTCQFCCKDEWENPCNGKRHKGFVNSCCGGGGNPCDCDSGCCECCECCDCCDCG